MTVVDLSISKKEEEANKLTFVDDTLREEVLGYAKDFKRSWLHLGRHLYAIYQDQLFQNWGFKKFEDYTEEELGIKKTLCLKLLKVYLFIEQDEPEYLNEEVYNEKDVKQIPNYDSIDVLRLAKQRKELNADDYRDLKHQVFEKGKEATAVRKELTAMIKERKEVNPEEERENRNEAAIKKLIQSLKSFKRDMETLKLIDDSIVTDAKGLLSRLETQVLDEE